MHKKIDFVGKWVSSLPFDSEDYLVEYVISLEEGRLHVRARDLQDNEQMQISDVGYRNGVLRFTSLMPSTKRKGINRFRLKNDGRMEVEFRFTVIEELKKVDE